MITPGSSIAAGQTVMELETDKAVVEVPSSVSGVVKDIRVKQGEKVKVGQVIFTVENGAASKSGTVAPSVTKTEQAPSAASPAKQPPPAKTAASSPTPSESAPSIPGANEFKLPELGENIHQGDLVRLMISPGSEVAPGQAVMELETDKAVVEVPSSVGGKVKEVRVKQGDKVKVGQVIFTLEAGSSAPAAPAAKAPAPHTYDDHARATFQAAIAAEGKTEEQALPPDQPKPAAASFSMPAQLNKTAGAEHRDPVPAAPHTRRLARELGVDIHAIKGSGPGGRISEDDVKAFAKGLISSPGGAARGMQLTEPALPDFSKWGKIERVSMRGVRRKTAEHLRQAWNTIPHVTQQDKADITELEQLRAK